MTIQFTVGAPIEPGRLVEVGTDGRLYPTSVPSGVIGVARRELAEGEIVEPGLDLMTSAMLGPTGGRGL